MKVLTICFVFFTFNNVECLTINYKGIKTMKTNSTMAQPTKMNSRELLASKLRDMVSTNKQSIVKIDDNSWRFPSIEVDSKVNDYIVKLVAKTGKSGKQFKKRELYRVVDGAEQKVELGEYKKEYLYKIVHGLTTTKAPRERVKDCDFNEIKSMCAYIKEHKDEFTMTDTTLTGKVPQGDFRLEIGHVKPMKNDHKRVFGRQLFINDQLFAEGGGLIFLQKAFNSKKRGKKPQATKAESKKA